MTGEFNPPIQPNPAESEVTDFVVGTAHQLLKPLSQEVGVMTGYTVGNLAAAILQRQAPDAAMEYTSDAINMLDLDPGDRFIAWCKLFEAGAPDALTPARALVGLQPVGPGLVEYITDRDVRGLHSAERLVTLVAAGDLAEATVSRARKAAEDTDILYSPDLLAQLYAAGDDESFDSMLTAAHAGIAYCLQYKERKTDRVGGALYKAAKHASQQGRVAHVERAQLLDQELSPRLRELDEYEQPLLVPSYQIDILSGLYASTHNENYAKEGLAIKTGYQSDNLYGLTQFTDAGYQPAIESLTEELVPRPQTGLFRLKRSTKPEISARDIDKSLGGLVALYKHRVDGAAEEARRIVQESDPRYRKYYIWRLGQVGMQDEYRQMALDIAKNSEEGSSAWWEVFRSDKTVTNLQTAQKKSPHDPFGLSIDLRFLASSDSPPRL